MKRTLLFLLLASCSIFAQQPYYSDVNLTLTGTALRDELATKVISTHTNTISYTPGVWEACKVTDLDPTDVTNSNVLLIYGYNDNDGNYVTDRTRSKDANGGSAGTDWNREHTYAKSLGSPDLGTSGPGADAHHLRASDVTLNGNRGSLKFAAGSGNAGTSGGGWYPGDEWKGDVARMMMYMYLRYGDRCYPSGVVIGTTNSVDSNMIDLFLDWNAEDPVSAYEDQRNTYHDSSNTYAQGNRNPFIDNPNLATQIWGGTVAEDRWNLVPDTENPTQPTNLTASNITNTTVDLTWTASTDNVAVTSYDIHVDGSPYDTSNTNSVTLTGLTRNTSYSITVFAKDAAGNTSSVSNTENITTDDFDDTVAPSAITDLTSSNITSTTVDLSWTASTDNVAVTGYDIFQDGGLIASSATNSYQVTGLTPETSYDFTVKAKDAANNTSAVSNIKTVLTSSAPTGASELFISEYVEGSGFNKAIEIVNITGTNIDLSNYSLRRQNAGAGTWETDYPLSGTIANGDVFVIINSDAADTTLQSEKDDEVANITPMTFNGNDPVGLFKNNVLIDIVGTFDGGSANFAKDVTLRRKSTISSPNTTYTTSEWDSFSQDTTSDIGSFSSTLSTKEFEDNLFIVYPNPAKNNKVTIALKNSTDVNSIQFYNLAGQLVINKKQPTISNKKIEVDNIPSGMYIVKIENNTSQSVKRLIVE